MLNKGTALMASVGVVSISLAVFWSWDRINWVGKCWWTGRALPACNCTFSARNELPSKVYRDLADDWAHNPGDFTRSVMIAAVWEATRIGTGIGKDIFERKDTQRRIKELVVSASEQLGWKVAMSVAENVAASLAAPIAVAKHMRRAYAVYRDLDDARSVMSRRCGSTNEHFLARVEGARRGVQEAMNATAQQVTKSTADVTTTTADWAKKLITAVRGWLPF